VKTGITVPLWLLPDDIAPLLSAAISTKTGTPRQILQRQHDMQNKEPHRIDQNTSIDNVHTVSMFTLHPSSAIRPAGVDGSPCYSRTIQRSGSLSPNQNCSEFADNKTYTTLESSKTCHSNPQRSCAEPGVTGIQERVFQNSCHCVGRTGTNLGCGVVAMDRAKPPPIRTSTERENPIFKSIDKRGLGDRLEPVFPFAS
jgi:hypothetical protein